MVDRWLEKAVAVSYDNEQGERCYWVVLGVLSIQRAFNIAGPLLKNTWIQLRGWRLRAEWWSVMIGSWLAFEGLLRPGEVDELKISDLCFPEEALSVQVVAQASDGGMDSGRLSRALRELAAALDEVNAAAAEDPVLRSGLSASSSGASSGQQQRQQPQPRGEKKGVPTAAAPKATGAAARVLSLGGSSVAYRMDHRCYIVVSNPRAPDFVGFFEGEGAAAWKAIERRLPRGRLSGSSVRLRRVPSRQVAEQ
ncbi:ANK2, partial [Symbiodinium necroappetens]